MIEDPRKQLTWLCRSCKITSKKFSTRILHLETTLEVQKTEMKSLKNQLAGLQSRLDEVERKQSLPTPPAQPSYASVVGAGTPGNRAHMLTSMKKEESDQKNREKNICIRGTKPIGEKEDLQIIEEIGRTLIPGHKFSGRPCRVGKVSDEGTQLLIVTLDSADTKATLVRRAKLLRNYPQWDGVYLAPDLTPAEREVQFLLRQELRKKRAESGASKWIIRGNKIVRAPEEAAGGAGGGTQA